MRTGAVNDLWKNLYDPTGALGRHHAWVHDPGQRQASTLTSSQNDRRCGFSPMECGIGRGLERGNKHYEDMHSVSAERTDSTRWRNDHGHRRVERPRLSGSHSSDPVRRNQFRSDEIGMGRGHATISRLRRTDTKEVMEGAKEKTMVLPPAVNTNRAT